MYCAFTRSLLQPSRRVALAPRISQFHSAIAIRNANTAEKVTDAKPAAARTASSVPKGQTLTGINFLKEGKDPVALDDSEYPDWLWDLLDEKKQKQKTTKPTNRTYHRKKNRDAIKAMNFMKDKKT
ncbi:mitochondrial ribosomal protein L37-domain-containing protein [Zychaea mexicana]|uniref:mitochondrial ribosomal protein L37-domain-containing protein n=1 Tax=Zychaea mexicana TaxID=64656 RepID=UPI0022FEBB7A|nr:mitochondrial ribosomal protein L37-domain-containing protein [Zychaea mexicana]KAI9492786.1 mitochondrial ribosomal protein L37-domain-containing protein [Zychaea mexicana]